MFFNMKNEIKVLVNNTIRYFRNMGIKDLYKVIKKHAPDALMTISFSEMTGYRFAVDISIFLYKYIRSSGEKYWADNFIMMLCSLKRNSIKTVCIFDGPNPPIEKKEEQQKRRKETKRILDRLEEAERLRDLLAEKYVEDPDGLGIQEPEKRNSRLPDDLIDSIRNVVGKPRKRIKLSTDWKIPRQSYDILLETVERLHRQSMPITNEHKEMAKRIVRAMGLGCIEAPGEAETLCAYLCRKKFVDAVLTEDTDVLPYGTPIMVAYKDFKITEEKLYCIHYDTLLEELEMDESKFRDLCILLRCDYNKHNPSIKGRPPDGKKRKKNVSIGMVGAMSLMEECSCLEECEKYIEDISPLNYRRCRELLTIPSDIPFHPIPVNSPLDISELTSILSETNSRITLEFIQSCWKPTPIEFESDESDD